MLTHHLRFAVRSLLRRPFQSATIVGGLAVGMASCLLILLFARHEWSFDRFHENADAIYRINIRSVTPGRDVQVKAGQPLPLAAALSTSFAEVRAATGIMTRPSVQVLVGDAVHEVSVLFADSAFFDVFTFPLIDGDARTALTGPESAVASASTARTLFGSIDAVGRMLRVDLDGTFRDVVVTAVAEDPPEHSGIRFDLVLPTVRYPGYADLADSWTSWVTNTFVRLGTPGQAGSVGTRLPAFVAEHYAPMIRTWEILQWIGTEDDDFGVQLQPLSDIHFSPDVLQSQTPATNPRYPFFLLALAVGVLLIACINFTTLAIGRAAQRAREVGVRKVLGAARGQLIRQFWLEALLTSLAAVLLAVVVVRLLLPAFAGLTGTVPRFELDPLIVGVLVLLVLLTGLVAGVYPSFYLTRFVPVEVMKGSTRPGTRNRWMQALVVLQFALSVVFIVAVLVVSGQLGYMRSTDLGFDREHVIVVRTQSTDQTASDRLARTVKAAWGEMPGVRSVTAASSGFEGTLSWSSFGSADGEAHTYYTNRIDTAYLGTMGLRIVEGRGFTDAFPGDVDNRFVVNQALVRDFGWDDPIGQTLGGRGEVVGVVEDYHFQSLHSAVEPMLLSLGAMSDAPYRFLYVRLSAGDPQSVLGALESSWRQLEPDRPFVWSFLDSDLDHLYVAEARTEVLVGAAGALAILLACLGLLGLTARAAARRTREIGIRRVFGAGVPSIVGLLSMEFVGLVAVAAVVAAPIAWLGAERWLDGFAYRIELSPWIPALAGLIALGIALVTVTGQALRAAVANPVDSLRSE